jgi:ADP-heptose:LPS heptosyltransferase
MTTIVVRRTGALGDVVLATPVVRHLRRVLGFTAAIAVQTAYPDVFLGNPHVDAILAPTDPVPKGAIPVDLNLAYESRPTTHIVDAYGAVLEASGFPPIPEDRRLQELFPPDHAVLDQSTVAVHAARSWPSRTLPASFWLDVTGRLRAAGVRVVHVGTDRDSLTGPYCNRPLMETAAILARCAAFLGSDSSLLHVAAAVGTPVVGLFTSVRPEYRMPLGGEGVAFVATGLSCVGCLERAPVPTTNLQACERGDVACVWRFDPAEVTAAVMELVRNETVAQSA